METNTKTAWQNMGYSWRDGNGTVTTKQSLAYCDPFMRAYDSRMVHYTLAAIARTIRHLGTAP